MLAALLVVQVLVTNGAALIVLQSVLVLTGFVAMVQWARRNRAQLDHLEWCGCASSQVTMRVIASHRGQLVHVEEADVDAPLDAEPVMATLVDAAR